jgi:SAM-dependent methyltransferase
MIEMVRKSADTKKKEDKEEEEKGPSQASSKKAVDIATISTNAKGDNKGSTEDSARPIVVSNERLKEVMENYRGVLPIDPLVRLDAVGIAELTARAAEIERRRNMTKAAREERLQHIQQTTKENPAVVQEELYSVASYPAERLPFPDGSFDTVVDMFGLCCFDNPVTALREMSRVCKPQGKLLLLEHGKGTSERVNDYLDKFAPRHAKMWGCWWNRDIRRCLRLAGITPSPDSRLVAHFGTTVAMVCPPFKHNTVASALK